MYASMVSYAEHHLSLSGASTAAFIAASGIGGLVLPWSIGQLFDRYGADSLPPTILAGTVATILAAGAVRLVVGRVQPAGALAQQATPR
jgi:fucose permease